MTEHVPSEPEDFLGTPISADGLFHGWEWPKPCTPAEFTEVAEFFRDRLLFPVRVKIEQEMGFDSLVSIDCEDLTKPIQMAWQTQLAPTSSWSSQWGVVCQGMRIVERVDGRERPIGMVQIGGTWVTGEEFQHLPSGAFIKDYWRQRQGRYYLLLLETYFVTRWSIENYDPTREHIIREPEALWHQTEGRDAWLNVVEVMGRAALARA